jgi:serine/threonine protein kinase
VKVLDFGLALAMSSEGGDSGLVRSPTTSKDVTLAGTVLGTPAYMSPEQARGQVVDARTDIWAFGCVLYEMLTGSQAFGGGVGNIFANVIKESRSTPCPQSTSKATCACGVASEDPGSASTMS